MLINADEWNANKSPIHITNRIIIKIPMRCKNDAVLK